MLTNPKKSGQGMGHVSQFRSTLENHPPLHPGMQSKTLYVSESRISVLCKKPTKFSVPEFMSDGLKDNIETCSVV